MDSERVFELKRQSFHLFLGVAIALAVYLLKPTYGGAVVVPLLLGVLVMLVLPKIRGPLHISEHLLYHFEREQDIKRFPYKGAILFGLGVTAPILFLPTEVCCAVIATLATGDSFSTIIGKFYGKHRIGKKSFEGTLAFIFFAFIGAAYFVDLKTAIKMAFLGAMLELIPEVDDNISIPWGLTALINVVPALF